MTKLKTLKDLQFRDWNSCNDDMLDDYIRGVLKQEAIKWVKGINKRMKGYGANEQAHSVTWIKHFFNITEEDLK